MPTDNMKTVLEAIESDDSHTGMAVSKPDEYRTHSGFLLKLWPVPPFLMLDARGRVPEPLPPLVHIDDKDTEEENPSDPSYVKAMVNYRSMLAEVANAILLTRGTSILKVPAGFSNLDDSTWAEDVTEFADIPVPEPGKRRRYYCYLKYVVLTHLDDFNQLLRKITSLSGMTAESEVTQAEESFRGDPELDAAEQVHSAEEA